MALLPNVVSRLFSLDYVLDYGTLIINIYKNILWKDEDLRGQKCLCPNCDKKELFGNKRKIIWKRRKEWQFTAKLVSFYSSVNCSIDKVY